jgi:hypothetical protein
MLIEGCFIFYKILVAVSGLKEIQFLLCDKSTALSLIQFTCYEFVVPSRIIISRQIKRILTLECAVTIIINNWWSLVNYSAHDLSIWFLPKSVKQENIADSHNHWVTECYTLSSKPLTF